MAARHPGDWRSRPAHDMRAPKLGRRRKSRRLGRDAKDAPIRYPLEDAILATGRKTLIVSGVATEVIVLRSALSVVEHGPSAQV